MNCDTAKSHVYPYVDSELTARLRAEMDAHLAGCGPCRLVVEHELAFRRAYVATLRPDPAPQALRRRVDRLLTGLSQSAAAPRPRSTSWRPVVAAVLLLAVGVTVGLGLASALERRKLLTSLAEASVDQHQKLIRGLLPRDIGGVSPKAAEEWFRNRLAFNVQLPEENDGHLALLGARISHLGSIEVAALEYWVDHKHVSLFVLHEADYQRLGLGDTPKFVVLHDRGHEVIIWQHRGSGYALVSENGGRCYFVQNAALPEVPTFTPRPL
jgi:anti-sigma factor RsiW